FSEPGDAVLLQLPSYPPFMRAIEDTGRSLIANPMRDDGTRWVLDLAAYEAAPDPRTRMLTFCHPQNPTGRAYSRGELEAVAAFAIRHDLVVVSDEIHADIVYPGNTHIPLASLHPEIAARTITITSATKSFNIPALRCAVMHFGAPALKEGFQKRIPSRLLGTAAPHCRSRPDAHGSRPVPRRMGYRRMCRQPAIHPCVIRRFPRDPGQFGGRQSHNARPADSLLLFTDPALGRSRRYSHARS